MDHMYTRNANYYALLAKSPAFYAEQAGFGGATPPPQYVLDRLAEEKLTGKYDVSASNICDSCFTARCANGSCFCEE